MRTKKALGAVLIAVGGVLPHNTFGYTWKIPKAIRHSGALLFFDHCGTGVDIGKNAKVSSRLLVMI